MKKTLFLVAVLATTIASNAQGPSITVLKAKIDSSIINKTAAQSITRGAIGGRMKELADILVDSARAKIDKGDTVTKVSTPTSVKAAVASAIAAIPAPTWDQVTSKPVAFPPATHTHGMSDVSGLSAALAGKEGTITAGISNQYWAGDKTWQPFPSTFPPSAHTHEPSDLRQGGATTGQALVWNGSTWVPGTVSGGGGGDIQSTLTAGSTVTGITSSWNDAPIDVYSSGLKRVRLDGSNASSIGSIITSGIEVCSNANAITSIFTPKVIINTDGSGTRSVTLPKINGNIAVQTDIRDSIAAHPPGVSQGTADAAYVQKSMADNTVQYIDVTNNNSYGQSSRQLHFGSNETIVDAGLNFQKGALINVTAPILSGGGKPVFQTFSCPGSGTVNGMAWLNYPQTSGKTNWMLMVRSNSSESGSGSTDVVYAERLITTERAGVTIIGKLINVQGVTAASNDHWFPGGGEKVTFTDPVTRLVQINNNDVHRWSIGAAGEVHNDGAIFCTPVISSSNITVTRANLAYQYTGTGGTVTLDNPTTNAGQVAEITNMGSGDLTTNYAIYLDGTTSTTLITYGFPNNRYKIRSDGTRYYAIP